MKAQDKAKIGRTDLVTALRVKPSYHGSKERQLRGTSVAKLPAKAVFSFHSLRHDH